MQRGDQQDKERERRFWDIVAGQRVYAAFDDSEYAKVIDTSMGDLEGRRVVDVGCASGVSAALLAARGAAVIGVDISPDLVAQAQRLWTEFSDRITFMVGDAEHLELEDASVDVCFFGGVLHHFPKREQTYRECLRILKPGGKFVALEPNVLDFMERIEWAVAGWRGKLSPNEFPIDPRVMAQELIQAGFKDAHFWTTRHDIPVLAQFPGLKCFFSRKKGFWFKRPVLSIINLLRDKDHAGTFFVVNATKEA